MARLSSLSASLSLWAPIHLMTTMFKIVSAYITLLLVLSAISIFTKHTTIVIVIAATPSASSSSLSASSVHLLSGGATSSGPNSPSFIRPVIYPSSGPGNDAAGGPLYVTQAAQQQPKQQHLFIRQTMPIANLHKNNNNQQQQQQQQQHFGSASASSASHYHQQQQQQKQYHQYLQQSSTFHAAHHQSITNPLPETSISPLVGASSSPTNLGLGTSPMTTSQNCPIGPPPQWRPMLDVASKAHLSPIILHGKLIYMSWTPIGKHYSSSPQSLLDSLTNNLSVSSASIVYELEANFQILKTIKNSLPHFDYDSISASNFTAGRSSETNSQQQQQQPMLDIYRRAQEQLMPGRFLTLYFKVSAPASASGQIVANMRAHHQFSTGTRAGQQHLNSQHPIGANNMMNSKPARYGHHNQGKCAINLDQSFNDNESLSPSSSSSSSLSSSAPNKSAQLELNQKYILFVTGSLVDQYSAMGVRVGVGGSPMLALRRPHSLVQQQQLVDSASPLSSATSTFRSPNLNGPSITWSAYATPELLTNASSLALKRILCLKCAKEPRIETLGAPSQSHHSAAANNNQLLTVNWIQQQAGNKLRLECKIYGHPKPWILWFRNGKPLKNRPNRIKMTTTRSKRSKLSANSTSIYRIARLDIDQTSEKNDTGLYECRAMNVVAREPAIGAFRVTIYPPSHYNPDQLPPRRPNTFYPIPLVNGKPTINLNNVPQSQQNLMVNQTSSLSSLSSSTNSQASPIKVSLLPTLTHSTRNSPAPAPTPSPSPSPSLVSLPLAPNNQATTTIITMAPSLSDNTETSFTLTKTNTTGTSGLILNPSDEMPSAVVSSNVTIISTSISDATSRSNININSNSTINTQSGGSEWDRSDVNQRSSQESGSSLPMSPSTAGVATLPSLSIGRPCRREVNDAYCLNNGTCTFLDNIGEYICNCAAGYVGRRCDFKQVKVH